MSRFRSSLLALLAGVGLAGCALEPPPIEQAIRQSDDGESRSASLANQLIHSFEQAGLDATLKRLGDPNDQVALAAARAAGRWPVRKDRALAQRAADALAGATAHEQRPAILTAEVLSLANLLCNRQGLAGGPLDPAKPISAMMYSLVSLHGDEFAAVRTLAKDFLRAWSDARRPNLGENVYDGPGWKAPRPAAPPSKPRPARRYAQPIHAIPVVAAGELHLGDLNGDGALDYLIIDQRGPQVRMTAYDHGDAMLWSRLMVGEDRPAAIPPGDLPDLDGDGRAEVVYADRAGRIIVIGGDGQPRWASEPFRTLDGEPYFGGGPVSPTTQPAVYRPEGRLWLANLRGAGRRDLLLTNGASLLALTERFKVLWHVSLQTYGRVDFDMLITDLDGDGTDEIVHDQVAIGHDGRVLWTWPRAVRQSLAAGVLADNPNRLAVLASPPSGTIGGFDAAGLLWEAAAPQDAVYMIAGRFGETGSGRRIGFVCGLSFSRKPPHLLGGLGTFDLPMIRRHEESKLHDWSVYSAGLVCDWNGDGVDEVFGLGEVFGWYKWPNGPAVEKFPIDGPLVSLADVDGDGQEELLYFQDKTLIIHHK